MPFSFYAKFYPSDSEPALPEEWTEIRRTKYAIFYKEPFNDDIWVSYLRRPGYCCITNKPSGWTHDF